MMPKRFQPGLTVTCTAFGKVKKEDLPDDWECPECFAEKERLVNINQRRKEFPRS